MSRELNITRCAVLAFLFTLLLPGCASDPQGHADEMARRVNMQREAVMVSPFVLTAYVRITRDDYPLHIYIEGDGLAWRNRYQASDDPTPRKALGLSLAVADTSPNVVYLARPCQFTSSTQNPVCQPDYWTGKRFAPEVVSAMDRAVSDYAQRVPGQPLQLTGYSGGGAIAVLVAARRHDISLLRTVAGNLDHAAVNRYHAVSSMPDSLNPRDEAAHIATLPQLHFSGADDRVVPPFIARDFSAAVGPCAHWHVIPDLGHEGNWSAIWPQLLLQTASCQP